MTCISSETLGKYLGLLRHNFLTVQTRIVIYFLPHAWSSLKDASKNKVMCVRMCSNEWLIQRNPGVKHGLYGLTDPIHDAGYVS